MDAIESVLRRLSLLVCALTLMSGSALAEPSAPPGRNVTIVRGETYVIKGADPKSAPALQPLDNPNALVIDRQPNGDVLILGAEAGSGIVRVTMPDGTLQSYTLTVRSLADASKPLTPASEPAAASEASTESVPLDSGAGPSASHRGETLVAPPEATAPMASSKSEGPSRPFAGAPADESSPELLEARGAAPSNVSQLAPRGEAVPMNPAISGKAEDGTVAAHMPHYLPDDAITLMSGTSRLFDLPTSLKRLSIADSSIADIQVVNPQQLMLVGHKPGFTTLAVWDAQGNYEERQVHIEQTGHQQVLLNCVVAEVDRSRLETTGINYSGSLFNTGLSIVGLPGSVATPFSPQTQLSSSGANGNTSGGILPLGGQLIPMILSNSLTYGIATQNGQTFTQTFLQYLETHQLGRVLAEPHLLSNSGEEAKFLSGGEIPIVIAQALNTSVVFKQFGTSVAFIPTVIGKSEIEMIVKPEVSKPDLSQGVQLFGFTVPAFVTRRAETAVRMMDNQTLIIAGLLSNDRQAVVNKVPYLGDVPVAGALFRTTSYKEVKTELVISVTPQIVRPLPASVRVPYPTQGALGPEDIRTGRLDYRDAARPRF